MHDQMDYHIWRQLSCTHFLEDHSALLTSSKWKDEYDKRDDYFLHSHVENQQLWFHHQHNAQAPSYHAVLSMRNMHDALLFPDCTTDTKCIFFISGSLFGINLVPF